MRWLEKLMSPHEVRTDSGPSITDPTPQTIPPTSAANKHVCEYLSYYLDLAHAPRFAVLLSGPWGVGKTHLLKAFLKSRFGDEANAYVYVSLYGLSNLNEIDDALFQAVYPMLTGMPAKIAGRVGTAALKWAKFDADQFSLKDFASRFKAKLYVFDDLERCDAKPDKVLGYINQFVEHGDAKVIVLANEKEISDRENYDRRREKLIGKTLDVRSEFEAAFGHFAENIDHPDTRSFIQASAADIAKIYDLSELNNLRILQQTLWDFERFHASLLPEYKANNDAILTLMRLIFVLSFEFKAGRIAEADIRSGRGMHAMVLARLNKEEQKSAIEVVADRYPIVDVNDNILSNELLVDFLVRGTVDANAINAEIKASSFFITVADEPSWRTVWHWLERSDAEFENALAKMEQQFAERAFVGEGELLHVLGLRLFLSDRGILPVSRPEIVEQGKIYIDDLYETKKLLIRRFDDITEIRFSGWDGLGIHENEAPDFKELFSYLTLALKRTAEDNFAIQANIVLSEMKKDAQKFLRRLCWTSDGSEQQIREPVLAKLDVAEFVEAMVGLHPQEQRIAMMALKGRYEGAVLDRELADEKLWIIDVRDALLARSETLKPIAKYRIQKLVEWNLKAAEAAVEKAKPLSSTDVSEPEGA